MVCVISSYKAFVQFLSRSIELNLKVNIQPKKIFAVFSFLWLLSSSILLSMFDTQIMNCLPRHKNLSFILKKA